MVPSPQIMNITRRHLTAHFSAVQGSMCNAQLHPPVSLLISFSSSPWGSVPTAAIPLPGVEHRVERLLGHLRRGLLHPRLQPEPLLQAGDSEAALHGQTLPGSASSIPGGK